MTSVRFFEAYLVFFIFWAQLLVGSLGLLMIHALTGGEWGKILALRFHSVLRFAPLLALLFLPILLGAHVLYPWIGDKSEHASSYLNFTFFVIRAVICLGLWNFLARRMRVISSHNEASSSERSFCAVGLILLGLTATFASIDWMMSREPRWASSIYGLIFIGGSFLSAISYGILVATKKIPLKRIVLRDLGNLLLTFTIFWAYVSFMQFLIIWSGNLPDEVTWYVKRSSLGWLWIAQFLAALGFFLPLVCLLFVRVKQSAVAMACLAALVLAVRWVDIFWLVVPPSRSQLTVSFFDIIFALLTGASVYWMRLRIGEEPA